MGGSFLILMHLDSFSLLSFEITFSKVKQNQRPRFAAHPAVYPAALSPLRMNPWFWWCWFSSDFSSCSFEVSFGTFLPIVFLSLNVDYFKKKLAASACSLFTVPSLFIPKGFELAPIPTVCFLKAYPYFWLTPKFQSISPKPECRLLTPQSLVK